MATTKDNRERSSEPICENVKEADTTKCIIIIVGLFFSCIAGFMLIYISFPELDESERAHIKLPTNIADAKNLGRVLDRYKEEFYVQVLSTVLLAYIFLQTFAIPGSISLSILSGFLYPFPVALTLIAFCSATGASFCYLISYNFGRKIIQKYFPDKMKPYAALVQKHRRDMLNYIIFLRITPVVPNWFINIAAPIVEVPFIPFWLGTFIGVMPPSFVAIQAGKTLHQLTSIGGTWSWFSVTLLVIFALLSLIPVLYRNKLNQKIK